MYPSVRPKKHGQQARRRRSDWAAGVWQGSPARSVFLQYPAALHLLPSLYAEELQQVLQWRLVGMPGQVET